MRFSILPALLFAATVFAAGVRAQTEASSQQPKPGPHPAYAQVPPGTILPIRLNHGLASKNRRPGQAISERIMQDVPLPQGGKLPAGAKVLGTILAATPGSGNSPGMISFRFNAIEYHHTKMPLMTNLRALASSLEVQFAQTPETSPGFGTPYNWATTELIGGDQKYGVGGPVTDRGGQTVGEGTADGVLVHVRAQAGSPCHGEPEGQDRLQALWVFSSDACGVYGMAGVRIIHAGRTAPLGEIVLSSEAGDVNVRAGSGMLLRVQ